MSDQPHPWHALSGAEAQQRLATPPGGLGTAPRRRRSRILGTPLEQLGGAQVGRRGDERVGDGVVEHPADRTPVLVAGVAEPHLRAALDAVRRG